MWDMSATRETSQDDMSPLKEAARTNMDNMLVTEEVSQSEMSWLKEAAL